MIKPSTIKLQKANEPISLHPSPDLLTWATWFMDSFMVNYEHIVYRTWKPRFFQIYFLLILYYLFHKHWLVLHKSCLIWTRVCNANT
jgi:hypothetical protein